MSKVSRSQQEFNPNSEAIRISKFVREYVIKARASGIVIAISGGIDSAVSGYLAVKAIGRKKVRALLLFEDDYRNSTDFADAKAVISRLKIKSFDLSISPAVDAFKNSLVRVGLRATKISLGNIKARCRMVFLYSFANENNLLVIGTGDRSEEEIGFFTKYGDGGVDLQPIAHLYKTQVKALAKKLGVPKQIIEKRSSPRLWKRHEATDEIPTDYPTLDEILNLLFNKKTKPQVIARKLGIPAKVVNDVIYLHEKNAHKRYPPPGLL